MSVMPFIVSAFCPTHPSSAQNRNPGVVLATRCVCVLLRGHCSRACFSFTTALHVVVPASTLKGLPLPLSIFRRSRVDQGSSFLLCDN